jgi:hypothetical protein
MGLGKCYYFNPTSQRSTFKQIRHNYPLSLAGF